MSFRYPLDRFTLTQGFGGNADYYKQYGQNGHNGLDLGAPEGTPVFAADDGIVEFEGWGQNHSWALAPAGIWILINHGGSYGGYAHLSSTVINKGQRVSKGQLIGYVGHTGAATGPHLHFEMLPLKPNFKNGYAGRIDPTPYMEIQRKGATVEEVRQAYLDILERPADDSGLKTYTTNGMNVTEVRNDLVNSAEKRQLDARKAQAILDEAKKVEDRRKAQAELDRIAKEEADAKAVAELKCKQYDELIKSNSSLLEQFIAFLTKLLKISKGEKL